MELLFEEVVIILEEIELIDSVQECDLADIMTEKEKRNFVNRLKATV